MKKLLTLGLVAFSAALLTGCSSSTPTDDAVAPVAEEATGVVAPVAEEATGVVAPVAEEATGVVATGAEVVTGN